MYKQIINSEFGFLKYNIFPSNRDYYNEPKYIRLSNKFSRPV